MSADHEANMLRRAATACRNIMKQVEYGGDEWFSWVPKHLDQAADRLAANDTLLRRVLSEYLAGNRIVDGHWYSPDECGEPHYLNHEATAEEVALIDSLKTEVGL